MTTNSRLLLALLFALAYGALLLLIHHQLRAHALAEAESQVEKFHLTYRSVRRMVRESQKPEIYRLQETGRLDPDYFSPNLLSSTFSARGFLTHLNQDLTRWGEPPVEFKLASDNPRNPINRADQREAALLEAMRRGEMREHKAVIERQDGPVFFYAMPTAPLTAECLRCHGRPEDAPRMMLELYGDKNGFYENAGSIRALASMQVPLAPYFAKADRFFTVIAWSLLAVFVALYLVLWVLLRRLQHKNQRIAEQNRALDQLSRHDPLTGALNRYGFRIQIDELLHIVQRYREPLSLILLDIDFFKRINDRYGHQAGDALLVEVTRRIAGHQRAADVLCRWGGEEFMLALPNTALLRARSLAERLRLALETQPLLLGEQSVDVTASLGVTEYREGDTLDSLISRADQAMYSAKRAGRNRVEIQDISPPRNSRAALIH